MHRQTTAYCREIRGWCRRRQRHVLKGRRDVKVMATTAGHPPICYGVTYLIVEASVLFALLGPCLCNTVCVATIESTRTPAVNRDVVMMKTIAPRAVPRTRTRHVTSPLVSSAPATMSRPCDLPKHQQQTPRCCCSHNRMVYGRKSSNMRQSHVIASQRCFCERSRCIIISSTCQEEQQSPARST